MRSRSMRSSESLFEDGQIRLTGAGRRVPWRQETCVHQAAASPDTPSEFVPFPVNLTVPDHIIHPEVGTEEMTLSDNPIGASYLYLLEPEIRFLEAAVEHLGGPRPSTSRRPVDGGYAAAGLPIALHATRGLSHRDS